jgi:hypothetical protein
MTQEPDELLDELLSADLDGETSPQEHDRIESDPELRSRRDALRAAALIAAQPPSPLPPATVDRMVQRAIDEAHGEDRHSRASVRSFSSSQSARARWRQTPALVAAVVVLLVAIGIGLIVTAPSRQPSDTASRGLASQEANKSAGATGDQGSPTSTGSRSGASEGPTGTPNNLGFLGSFTSSTALRSALEAKLPSIQPVPAPAGFHVSAGQADRCSAVIEAREPTLTRPNRLTTVAASLGGEPLVVLEYRARAVTSARTTTRVVALGAAACDEVLNFER